MKRRDFLAMASAASAAMWLPATRIEASTPRAFTASAYSPGYRNLLILVELKGGNDGLNTVVPYADPAYYRLRKNIGIKRGQLIQLDGRTALHSALQPLMPLWEAGELAIVQGVSYAQPNLSHFRSIEIWDTASRADQYLREGWLSRAFAQRPVPVGFAADGVFIGSAETGPLAHGSRAIALVDPMHSVLLSPRVARGSAQARKPGNARISSLGNDIAKAGSAARPEASSDHERPEPDTAFPSGAFGASIRAAMQALDGHNAAKGFTLGGRDVAVIRLTLNGFDTHQNQSGRHAALLAQLAEGLAAMKAALVGMGRWDSTLVMTYSEFGRHPRENPGKGTDHGTVAPYFATGGRVRGGLYGVPPLLAQLDGNGNLPVGVDFRQLYATVLELWWGLDSSNVLGERLAPLPLLRV
ncbi:DUF1501 domain-containing protein [Paraburkholderia saeva]|uniref:DUF1501 domain-containing protein n=1 Tax=Paraburkholderia saeva TaxID=2777537 RepID=UPI001D824C20|nr:DUF1501 domain-containing protein [Paraburkholderia saeva]CAG4892148.1 hypothetical protein R52603_01350 [Paraburkholderia saeva]CAG4895176.1 hypothetical protein R70241_01925 [Paraburkholderia saeva]